MKHVVLSLIFCLLFNPDLYSQLHLEPPNGGNGIPGTVARSFVIKWASVDSAVAYKYIMSDNPLCFEGCPGDTRDDIVFDTTATEFNLQEDKWYYWITRVHYLNGEIGGWSPITSFLAKTPPRPDKEELIKIAPNPVGSDFNAEIDWAVNPDAREIGLDIYSISGTTIIAGAVIKKTGNVRFQNAQFAIPSLTRGLYIVVFTVDNNPNNPNNRITKKIIIQ